jgi:hypothetical protein
LTGGEYFVLEHNVFGRPSGYNDVIDFSDCRRPGPVLELYGNTFTGGGDDGLDLDGCDAHIEGNTFMHFHKANGTSSTSNAVATGVYNGYSPTIVAARNVFVDNDHGVLLKESSVLVAENNVFSGNRIAAVNFGEWPDRTVDPGKGARLDGNIFWNNGLTFENLSAQEGKPDPVIVMNRCIAPEDLHSLGTGNIDADPGFINPEAADFRLDPDSPARGTGPNGLDMGADVPAGASISGEPDSVSNSTAAVLTVGGPGITSYRYSVNGTGGPWWPERTVADESTIELSNLAEGSAVTVYVMGRNSAGRWQTNPPMTASRTWKVERTANGVADRNAAGKPFSFALRQNAPNPFNSTTLIEFELPASGPVDLEVFDCNGRKTATLISGILGPGMHRIAWDGRDMASGLYACRLRSSREMRTIKMMLLR